MKYNEISSDYFISPATAQNLHRAGKGLNMKSKTFLLLVVIIFFSAARAYGQASSSSIENEQEAIEKETPSVERTVYMPNLSYTLISFDDIQIHNPLASLTIIRFNPAKQDDSFTASLFYSPQIMMDMQPDFPTLYHSAAMFINQKIRRHSILASFLVNTDKPIYGGLNTVMGVAGYLYNLIKGEHFSMSLGLNLIVMDIGVKLDNGLSWILWPIPSINLIWEYKWINFSFTPMPALTIAPKSPFCLTAELSYPEYDISLWYRFFRNNNPAAEMLGIGLGMRNDTNKTMFADGRSYGINYNALYGTILVFNLVEISGGWLFNGKEGYGENSYEKLIGYGGLSVSKYDGNIGQGFFVSIFARIMF